MAAIRSAECGHELVAAILEPCAVKRQPLGNPMVGLWDGLARAWLRGGQRPPLGDSGNVGPIESQCRVEHVSGCHRIGGGGHDVELVVLATAGGAHVQTSVGRGCRHELDAHVDGVTLVAVFGGGVAETYMLADVVGWQAERAVSGAVGHGQRPVGVGHHDVP